MRKEKGKKKNITQHFIFLTKKIKNKKLTGSKFMGSVFE